MNSRERILLIVLVTVVGGGALIFGTVQWFVKPMIELRKQITDMTEKRNDAQLVLDQYMEDLPKLHKARTRSLPADQAEAGVEYTPYLRNALTATGMQEKDVNVSHAHATDLRFAPTIQGVKKSGHQVMTFSVRAKGDLGQLIAALENMQRTPYEHRIKTLTIDRVELAPLSKDPNPKLNINLTIEALLVAKAERKQSGKPPEFDSRLITLPPNRKYADIPYKNIFAGNVPEPPPPVEIKVPDEYEDPPPPVRPKLEVPYYVHLVQTSPELHEAFLRNRVYPKWSPGAKSQELRLIAQKDSGAEHFKIVDQDTDYEFLTAKVLKVDSRSIYFQVRGTVYEWQIGTNLADAMENHVSVLRLDDLDLEADMEFAAVQIARDKERDEKEKELANKKTKKTSSKGPTKGPTKGPPTRGQK